MTSEENASETSDDSIPRESEFDISESGGEDTDTDADTGTNISHHRHNRRNLEPVDYTKGTNLKTRMRNIHHSDIGSESVTDQADDTDNDNGNTPRYSRRHVAPVDYSQGANLKTKLRNVRGSSKNVGYTSNNNTNLRDIDVLLAKASGNSDKKITRNSMLQRPDKQKFIDDKINEIEGGFKTGCFEQVERGDVPDDAQIYNLMWVYKVKPATELEDTRYRSRLCVLGNHQQPSSYSETFAAVAKVKMFRLLLTLCVYYGMKMTQLDVSKAFMYADLDREIYVYPPPGYKHLGILKLNKSLYGLKQAPRLWYDTMKQALEELGFRQMMSDVCCFTHPTTRCYVLMYVDDLCVCTADEQFRKILLDYLQEKFEIKHFDEARRYVGLQMKWSKDGTMVKVYQKDYISKMLDLFKMNDSKHRDTPAQVGLQLKKDDKKTKDRPYRAIVGSLLYVLGSRPDVASAIRRCSQFCIQGADSHWQAAKDVLRYLAGTKHMGVSYSRKEEYSLTAYCDSDWAAEEDRKSISGYVIYAQGGPVVWKSKKQPIVTLSSCEAEYVALAETIKEMLWISMALKELSVDFNHKMVIYIDNQAAKKLAENAVNQERTKHIDTRYHFIRQVVQSGRVTLRYVDTKENVSDLLTKTTTRTTFAHLVGKLVN